MEGGNESERERESRVGGIPFRAPRLHHTHHLSMQWASSTINATRLFLYTGDRNISLHLQQPMRDSGLMNISDIEPLVTVS